MDIDIPKSIAIGAKIEGSNGSDCIGVDLNRNYDIDWGTSGVSNDPCAEIYPGTKPFSEPESLAHKNDMLAIKNKVSCRDHRMIIIIFLLDSVFSWTFLYTVAVSKNLI